MSAAKLTFLIYFVSSVPCLSFADEIKLHKPAAEAPIDAACNYDVTIIEKTCSSGFGLMDATGKRVPLGDDAKIIPKAASQKISCEGSSGSLKLKLPDGTDLTLNASSEIRMDRAIFDPCPSVGSRIAKTIISPLRGLARLLSSNSKEKSYAVQRGQWLVFSPRGTDFTVEVLAPPRRSGEVLADTVLHVAEGSVLVEEKRHGRSLVVKAGRYVNIDSRTGLFTPPLKRKE